MQKKNTNRSQKQNKKNPFKKTKNPKVVKNGLKSENLKKSQK